MISLTFGCVDQIYKCDLSIIQQYDRIKHYRKLGSAKVNISIITGLFPSIYYHTIRLYNEISKCIHEFIIKLYSKYYFQQKLSGIHDI